MAGLIACARCESKAPTVAVLASHLATDHLISGSRAMAEAREAGGMEPAAGEWGPPRAQSEPAVRLTNETERLTRETMAAESDNFPASIWGPLTCPRCPNDYPRRVQLAQHLINTHGLTSTAALRAAQGVEKDQQRRAEREEREATVTVPVIPAVTNDVTESTAPKETPMPDLSTPISCKSCKKPFVRTHPRNTICPACAGTPKCSYCKKPGGGHTPGCRRAGAKKKAKPATGGGTHRAKKPGATVRAPVREPAARDGTNNGARKAGQAFLDQLHHVRDALDKKITAVESLLAIL